METLTMTEKTIFIRCSHEPNDLLDKIRKAEMPPRSRNSQIIYLIHKEAERLGVEAEAKAEPVEEPVKEAIESEPIKSGLGGLAEKVRRENLR